MSGPLDGAEKVLMCFLLHGSEPVAARKSELKEITAGIHGYLRHGRLQFGPSERE